MLHTLREQRLNSKLYNKTTELILSERQSDKNKDEEQLVLLCFVSPFPSVSIKVLLKEKHLFTLLPLVRKKIAFYLVSNS